MKFREIASTELTGLVDKLATAASAELEAVVGGVRTEAKTALEAERTAHRAAVDQVATLKQQLKEAEHQLKEAERRLKDAEHQLKDTKHQLKEASAAQSFADAARREADAAREKEGARREQLEQELDDASKKAERAQRDLDVAQQSHRQLKLEITAAEARATELERLQAGADEEHAAERRAIRERMAREALQSLDRLESAFARMVQASTSADVLTVLVEALAGEFSRVAFFDVNGNRLEGRHQVGSERADISKLLIPLTVASSLTDAVRDGRVIGLTARELDEPTRKLFGGEPTFVLVLPIRIRGQVTSVVYADNDGRPHGDPTVPQRGAKIAMILVWHAVPLLTKLAIEYEALAELRAYAASLVSNLESVYLADAASLESSELRGRLQQNLDYARQRFAARVSNEPEAAALLLEDQLQTAICAKPTTLFLRDLAALLEPAGAAPKSAAAKSRGKKAEAS